METPSLQLMVTFAAVAEHMSFSKAAAKLGVAKGTVSRSIAQLESDLGVELFHRTTHHVALSTAGAALYERTRAHLAALQAAVTNLPEREEAPSGLLRVTAPHDLGAIILPPVLAAFTRRYPKIRIDLRLGGHHVDLVKEGFDLAIRATGGPLKDSSLTVRKLARTTAGFYASPGYVARKGRPKHLMDDRHVWALHPAVVRLMKIKDDVQFQIDDFFVLRDLLREGVGVGVLPSFLVRDYVRDGLLEEVTLGGPPIVSAEHVLLYPSGGQPPKKVTAFRDALIDQLRTRGL